MVHLTRAEITKRVPIPRKGTKYVARASSHYQDGVPVIIAMRDMLGLSKNLREVRLMIKQKLLKINGKNVKNASEGIRLFNIFEAGERKYKFSLLTTGRFVFEETKDSTRLCKVMSRKMLRGKKTQLNFHDGTNILSDDKVSVGDTIELDLSGKIKGILPLEKGKDVFVYSGRSAGLYGKIESVLENKAKIKFEERSVELDKDHFLVVK